MLSAALAAVRAFLGQYRLLAFLAALIPGGIAVEGIVAVEGAAAAATGASLLASVARFFSSPIGKAVGVVLVGLSLFVAGDWHRARVDRAAWAAKVEASKQDAAKRDAEIQRKAAAEAAASISTIQAEADRLKTQVASYEAYITSHGGDACRATPGAAQRLRGL